MPIYVYRCRQCEKLVEYTQTMFEDPRTECPYCTGEIFRIIKDIPAISFKGKGFYVNDYPKEN